MHTKILIQVVLLAYLSENILVSLQAANVNQESVNNDVKAINPRQNQKNKLQPATVNDPAVPVQATLAQTLPDNQQTQTINYTNDGKKKNKPEILKPESIKNEVTSQPAYTNVPTPSWSSSLGRVNNKGKQNNYKIQGIEEQEETPTNPTQSRPTKNIILGVNSGLVKYSNEINQQANNNLLKPGTSTNNGLLNSHMNAEDYYEEEEEEEEEAEEEEEKAEQQKQQSLVNSQISHSSPLFSQKAHASFSQNEVSSSNNMSNNQYDSQDYEEEEDYGVKSAETIDGQFNVDDNTPAIYTPYNNYNPVNTNRYEPQQYSSTYNSANVQPYSSEEIEKEVSQDDNDLNDSQFKDGEKILNGYKTIKNILYMLHDYVSSTFNWIINKINNQMEKIEINQKDRISSN